MTEPTRRIEELRRELAANPTSRQFYQLGELLRRDGRVSEAADVLRAGLAHHQRYVAAWVALGRACVDSGASEEAVTSLREALALDAANPVAWRLLGEAHLALGDRRAGLEAMQRCLELVPGDEVLLAAVEALSAETQPPAQPPAGTPPAAAPEEEPFALGPAAVAPRLSAAPATEPAASPAGPSSAAAFEVEAPFGPFAMEELAPIGGDVFALVGDAARSAEFGAFGPPPTDEVSIEAVAGPSLAEAAPEPIALQPALPVVEAPMAAVAPEPVSAAVAPPVAPPAPVE
ncbi:MAG: tetratricopeptide repeat protein, partial [Thermoanaerobaculales bacterium]